MNKNYISLCTEKDSDLRKSIADLTAMIVRIKAKEALPDDLSENTANTKLYGTKRERRVLHLITTLLNSAGDVKLSDEDLDTLVLITTLNSEKGSKSTIVCSEGDSILELMSKYKDVKDLMKKLTTYCEKNNLSLDFGTGKVVAVKSKK